MIGDARAGLKNRTAALGSSIFMQKHYQQKEQKFIQMIIAEEERNKIIEDQIVGPAF